MKSKLFRVISLAAVVGLALAGMGDVMASTLAGRISTTASITFSAAQDAGTATWDYSSATSNSGTFAVALTDGSTANKANKIHVDTITTGTNYDLDAGTLTNPLGVAMAAFSRIVAVRVCAPSTNTANVSLTGDWLLTKFLVAGGDTLANVSIPVPPGGCFLMLAPSATGIAVTASTGDVLTVTPSGSETAYVTIIGS